MCVTLMNMNEGNLLLSLGRRIAQLREEAGLTQVDLAKKVPCDSSLLSRIERGRVAPSLSTLHGIASALGIPLAHLFASGSDLELPDLRRLLRSPDARLTYNGRTLSERQKERITELLDAALALGEEPKPEPSPSQTGIIAASMREREAYGRYDPALNAFLDSVIQKALEEYDRRHGGQQHTD